jgi:hypothetical protein
MRLPSAKGGVNSAEPDLNSENSFEGGLLNRRLNKTPVNNAGISAQEIPTYGAPYPETLQNASYDSDVIDQKKKKTKKQRKSRDNNDREPVAPDIINSMPEDIDVTTFQDQVDAEETEKQIKARKKEQRQALLKKIVCFALIAASVYLAFLIYGVFVTDYDYNQSGETVPQRMSVKEIAAAAEFKALQAYYLRARGLYEEALTLDYRLAYYPDDALMIASEYETMLEKVAKLSIDINAAKFSSGYGQLQKQLLGWVQTDIAVYLQNISAAIIQNNAEKADNAIVSRDVMYNDFMRISENIAVYGANTKGVTLGDIFEWSPEKYVKEEIEGLKGE